MTSEKESKQSSFLKKEDIENLKNYEHQINDLLELVNRQAHLLQYQFFDIGMYLKEDDKMGFAITMMQLFGHIHEENEILNKIQEIDEKRNKLESITIEKYICAGLEHIREEIEGEEEEEEEIQINEEEEEKDERKKEDASFAKQTSPKAKLSGDTKDQTNKKEKETKDKKE